MPIIFNPSGQLNIASDASDLPQQAQDRFIISNALTRCKNLHLDREGIAQTRRGSLKINTTAIDTDIRLLLMQAGIRYAFTGDQIYRDEISLITGLTEADWSAISYNAFNDTTKQVYALNGTDKKRIESSTVYEWGLDAPTDTPNCTESGGAGELSGGYSIKYTYAGLVGTVIVRESNSSPVSNTATLSDHNIFATLDRPNDSQITHVYVYRTLASGLVYYNDAGHATPYRASEDFSYTYDWESTGAYISGTGYAYTTNNSYIHSWESDYSELTSVTFGISQWLWEPVLYTSLNTDGTLGTLLHTTHNRPPDGTFVAGPAFDGTCFIIKDNLLHYSLPKQPEYWPLTYYIEVSQIEFPGKTIVFHNGQPYFITTNEIYYIQGTGHGTFFPLPMKAKTGAQSAFGAVSVRGHGIYHIGSDGIYLYSGEDKKITEQTLDPIFKGDTVNGLPAITDISNSWIFFDSGKLYFGYTSTGNTYPSNVIVFNLETGKTVYYDYGLQIRTLAQDKTNDRLLIGDSTGFIRRIESASDSTDDGTAISWEIQSKDFTLQTRAHFPRSVKYDIDASDADSVISQYILDDAVHQSHVIAAARNTVKRLVAEGNGNRAAMRVTGSGTVKIYSIEAE